MDLITTPVVFGQSPPANSIVHSTSVSLTSRSPSDPVHLVQYDDTLPMVAVALISNSQPYTVPSGAAVNVRLAKPDGHYVYDPAYGVSDDGQMVYIAVTVQMTAVPGKVSPIIEVVVNGKVAGTGFFVLDIDPNPIPEDAIESTDEYKTIQQLAAEVTQAAQIVQDNAEGIAFVQQHGDELQAVADNAESIAAVGEDIASVNAAAEHMDAILAAPQAATNAASSAQAAATSEANAENSATLAESWAVGGTGTRSGEDTDNAKFYAEQAQQVSQGAVGYYETGAALEAAHPTGQAGNWAIVGDTDTIWVWDTETGAWLDTSKNVNLSDYYTKSQADARYATAAQGEMAQTAVQTVNGKTGKTVTLSAQDVGAAADNAVFPYVIAAGMGAVLDKENQDLDLLLVDTNKADSANNRPFIFGVEDISRLTNSPYTGGPFYGYRYVIFSGHLVTVVIVEQYPVGGRTWGITYDHNISQWYGWRGTQM